MEWNPNVYYIAIWTWRFQDNLFTALKGHTSKSFFYPIRIYRFVHCRISKVLGWELGILGY
jgi:hypothetical protein